MKKHKTRDSTGDMRREYDFAGGVRGKYARRFTSSNVVVLDPDVAQVFPDSQSVNRTLRALARLVPKARRSPTRRRRAAAAR